jgi:hypothetical protein
MQGGNHATTRTLCDGEDRAEVEIRIDALGAAEELRDDDVYDPPPNPLDHVETDVAGGFRVERHTHDEFPVGAAPLHRFMHAANPVCHDRATSVDFVGVEEPRVNVQLQLEAVDIVLGKGFLDESEALLADLGVREVEASHPGKVGVEAPVGADFEVRVVSSEIGAAHRGDLHARVLYE